MTNTILTAGVSSTGIMLEDGDALTVSSGGLAVDTTVDNGGDEFISSSGTASGTTVNNGGFEFVSSGGFAGGTTVNAGGGQIISSGGSASGTVVSAGGRGFVVSGGTASGTILSSGGGQFLSSGGVANSTVVNNGGEIIVIAGGSANDTVVNSGGIELIFPGGTANGSTINTGGAIDLHNVTLVDGSTASLDSGTDMLTVTEGAATYTQQLTGDYTRDFFQLSNDGLGGTLVTLEQVPCYCRGTLILTSKGEVTVEDLKIGDRLITHWGAAKPIRWIGTRSYSARFAGANRSMLPVKITAGALADTVPKRDLFVSPLHAMYLDGVLIPANALVNGITIVQAEAFDMVEYFHLELDSHDVIIAEGALSESFIDDDSRGMFHNAAEYRRLYPDAPRKPAEYCAPIVEDGPELEAVRARIAARGGPVKLAA